MVEMEDAQIKQVSPFGLLAFIMLLSMFSGMIFSFLGAELIQILFGVQLFSEDMTLLQDPNFEHIRSLNMILIVCQHLGAFILPAFIFWQRTSRRGLQFFTFEKPNKTMLWLGIGAMVAAIPTIGMLAGWNESFTLPAGMEELEKALRALEASAAQVTETVLSTNSIGGLFINVFCIALIPALGEEFLFRGIIQQIFAKWSKNPHLGIWLAAALFSALHMQFYGFVPRFLLGGMLGYLFWFSGSIWVPIAAHFANNAIAIILTYAIQNEMISDSIANYGSNGDDWLGVIISIILVSFCLLNMYRKRAIKTELSI